MPIGVFLGLLIGFLSFSPITEAAYDSVMVQEKELRIIRITPEGENVPAGRQITIEFNRPVVAIGRMERSSKEIPITITPALNCQWRWLNTQALACNLDEKDALKPATKYRLTIQPGIRAEDGTTIDTVYRHRFTTQRPDVSYAWVQTWKSPGTPSIRSSFNQPVTKASLEAHLYFQGEGDAKERWAVKVEADPNDKTPPQEVNGEEARQVWYIMPQEELPLDSTVKLAVEPGLVSAAGPAHGNAARDILQTATFPEFAFLGVKCQTNAGKEILISSSTPQQVEEKCNPLASISLAFTSPVFRSQVKKHFIFTPAFGKAKPGNDPWQIPEEEYSRLGGARKKGESYDIWLPMGLKAAASYTMALPLAEPEPAVGIGDWVTSLIKKPVPATALKDEFGRKLAQPIQLTFVTDHRKPNFEIIHHTAVLEKNTDSEVPLYVNNLESVLFHYRSLTTAGSRIEQQFTQAIPKVQDIQFAVPFGVREILKGQSGAVYGTLQTTPDIASKSQGDRRLFAQVTPYQMHVKLGHFSTLVWVTEFATGNPVPNAKIAIYQDSLVSLLAPQKTLATATTDQQGIAMLPGTEMLDPKLELTYRWQDGDTRLFVRAVKGNDMAILPVSNAFEIDTWSASGSTFSERNEHKYGHMQAWGTTAQGIYRAGDTIQYKLYVRNQNDRTLVTPPKSGYTLEISDPMGNIVHTVDKVTLSEFGGYSGEYTTSKRAPVGWYTFRLIYRSDATQKEKTISWQPLRVLVSDFTPSPFKVTNSLNGDLFKAEQKVEVATEAKLHSGGAYTNASARITALLDQKQFASKDPLAKDFTFDSYSKDYRGSQQIYQKIEALDAKGQLRHRFTLPKSDVVYGKLTVESAVQDDRGKYIATQSQADYMGVDRLVGLHTTEWLYPAKKPATVEYIVVDERGKPVKDSAVTVTIERKITNVARVKGAGNAYLTNYTTDWKEEHTCKGTPKESALACVFTPSEAGIYRLTAITNDTKDNRHSTTQEIWVTGSDYVLWNDENDSYLQIIPEKTEYRVGETARYLVKNPYPGAKALITVERYGIIDRFVQTLEGSTPVIELPIKPDYLPGFYLSVVVQSPRVDNKPLKVGELDLGKPAFRIGYLQVPVKDPYKEMLITAKTAQDVYRPRDKVSVQLHAEPRFKSAKAEPVEFAVAVLDEAVFDLVAGGKSYFDPYQGFYKLENLDLSNYSLITRLVGRQKFEKKGANPGGDGGADLSMRDLFKFVAYWNPALKADKQGNAAINFTVPDNLTGWRVLALAVTPSDRLGLGEANFKVNRPTEVRPVMPNQITEGDQFKAGFSVMNRTDQKRTLHVTLQATGTLEKPASVEKSVTLEPYQRTTVWMPVQAGKVIAGRDTLKGEIGFTAHAEDLTDSDGLVHTVPVLKRQSFVTAANYGTTTTDKAEEIIAFPEHIRTDAGEVGVAVSPSVISNIEGAFGYLKHYPYTCWEQRLTKAVMASHFTQLKAYLPKDFSWDESTKLPQETLETASNFQTPSGGMAYFIADDRYADPYLSAYTALAFNWLRQAGHTVPTQVESRLHDYLLNFLRHDTAPDFYSDGMSSTVRAVALAALTERGKIGKDDLERYRSHMPQMSLFGKAHYLQAALQVKGEEGLATEISKAILAHANQTGGKFVFQEVLDDSYQRILFSQLRDNCAILNSFTAFGETPAGKELVGDVPFKLVRMISETRKNRDYWENTQENLFCMKALVDYSKVYEKTTPAMTVRASLDTKPFGETRFRALSDAPVTLVRNITANDPGRKVQLTLTREGQGRLYYATRLRYAPLDSFDQPTNAGMEIHREYSVERDNKWVLLKNPSDIKRGELVKVDIFLSLPAPRTFVVVDDPVPGGLEPVNRDLATASAVDAAKGDYPMAGGSWWFKFNDWTEYSASRWSFYHQELRHDSVRYYADYLPAGNYHLSYTAQAIAEGTFVSLPVHAEEMYEPDVFGKGVGGTLRVQGQ